MSRHPRLIASLLALGMTLGATLPISSMSSAGAAPPGDPQHSVIFVIDVSGSMEGVSLEQAQAALRSGVAALPAGTDAGLRSFGGECGDGGDLLIPVGPVDPPQFSSAIDALVAGGMTPTPEALAAAAGDLPDSGSRTIVLISDGESTCGDPCEVAVDLAASMGIDFRMHTVGYQVPSAAETELDCIARATGGTYVPVSDPGRLGEVLSGIASNPESPQIGDPDLGGPQIIVRPETETSTPAPAPRAAPVAASPRFTG